MNISAFETWLYSEGKSKGTIEKYKRDITALFKWLDGQKLTKETAMLWKEHLIEENFAPVTVNSMLASVNSYCNFAEENIHIKFIKIQKKIFRDNTKDLTKEEYQRLVETAYAEGNDRLALLMETICASGIRVSEVKYITLEAAEKGVAEISLKGKVRTIMLPNKLCRKLQQYAKKKNIKSGEIFVTKSGQSLSRRQIWAEMKKICKKAGVEASKVFPHNLRHLFAKTFYRIYKDIAHLADVLGHSSIETTRIYLISTGVEHQKQLERLGLLT